ncbi:MAG: glycosyltransferase family 9 protein [Capsulimonadaceae bacterium]
MTTNSNLVADNMETLVGRHSSIVDSLNKLVDAIPVSLPDRPRILIVKFWAIGDILMATPLLQALKRGFPGCHTAWLVDSRYTAILDGNPLLDEAIPFDSAAWRRHFRYGRLPEYLRMSVGTHRALRGRRFDAVINLTAEKWWAAWFQVAPVRIGLFPRPRPGMMGRLYTHAIPRMREPWLHNTEHYLLPAAVLGVPGPYDRRMSVPERTEDDSTVDNFLRSHKAWRTGLPLILLHPGTSQATKCWPADYFSALVDRIGDRHNVVVTGSESEAALANRVASGLGPNTPPIVVAAGALPDLRHAVSLVRRSVGVVTGDTSILHIASALDIPLVGLYGSTRPGDNIPLLGPSRLLFDDTVSCAPCYKAACPLRGDARLLCQRSITPARVYDALMALIEETDSSGNPAVARIKNVAANPVR